MPPKLSVEETDLYLLGGGPSETDDDIGKPFSDKAGKMLRAMLPRHANYSFDNVVRDYDHYKDSPPWVAMECCRALVTASIEKAKPRLIVGLGIQALQWMLNSSDMMGLRGRVFAVQVGSHKCWFLPTYDPQYVLEMAFKGQDPVRSKLGGCLKFDLAKAAQLAADLEPPEIDTPQQARAGVQPFNGKGGTQLAAVLDLISEARKAPVKAIDIETSHLRPYAANAKVLTAAISYRDVNFAFAIDHPKAGWKQDERVAIKKALKALLSDETTIVAHNASFEIEWLVFLLGRDVVFHDAWECTMVQSHFLDERRGKRGGNDEQFQPNPYQALDFLVKQHFGLAYKALFKLDRKNMSNADLDETLLYNGADTKYTLRLYKHQVFLLKQEGIYDAYQETSGRQAAVALMQFKGFPTDQKATKEIQIKLGGEIASVEARIMALPEVKQFIVDRKSFNPSSQPDVIKIFKDYVKVGNQLLNDQGKETVDKATLSKIKHPLAKDIEEFRSVSKLKSTYVDVYEPGVGAFIWPDNRIHPSVNITFAETGRTSSDSPNQQNWVSRGPNKYVRKQVVADKGHVLVAFDYGQLEGCTGAMCSKDKAFVKALWEDFDMHMDQAEKAVALYPAFIGGKHMRTDKAVMKQFRGLVKNKLVFPAFFGAAKESIAGYLENATGVAVPDDIRDRLFDDFWREYNGVYNWQKKLLSNYYETGYVESPTGRRRRYPLGRSQAINYPIQSVACDIVCRAMVNLSIYAAETGKWYMQPIMNIHDDISFAIPDEPQILEEAIEKIYRVMLDTSYYDFINVPLSVSCSVGYNWLEMDEIGKFWSHKDL